jgi:hypothetical protein
MAVELSGERKLAAFADIMDRIIRQPKDQSEYRLEISHFPFISIHMYQVRKAPVNLEAKEDLNLDMGSA